MSPLKKIVSVLLLVVFFTGLIKLFLPAPEKNLTEEAFFWNSKTFCPAQNNFVFGGDSRVYRGVSIEKFNEQLGGQYNSYNFGYSSAGYNEFYLDFLEDKIDQTSETKAIIVGLSPHSLTPEASKNDALNEYLNTSGFDRFEILYLGKYLQFFAPYRMSELLLPKKVSVRYSELFETGGWVKSDKIPSDSTEALSSYRTVFDDNQVNDTLVSALMTRVAEWNAKGIQVYGFRPPVTQAMKNLEDSLSGFSEAEIRLKFENAGGIWLDFNDADYVSYDGSHLNSESAIQFSEDLGKKLKLFLE